MLVKREWTLLALLLMAPMTAVAGNVVTDWDAKAVGIVQTGTAPPLPSGSVRWRSFTQRCSTR